MYKTKLQELCQKKAWQLPDYEMTKDGSGHNPSFQATVTVNGVSFQSQSPFRSSKQAQNDAAMLAFLHFSSSSSSSSSSPSLTPLPPPPPPPQPQPPLHVSSSSVIYNLSSNQIPEENGLPDAVTKNDDTVTDLMNLYKNQLQSYAQKRGLTLPIYSYEREGPPHASRFKCKVTVNGKTYESQDFFPTLSKAEHAAAKAALISLAPHGVEEDESAYKNLLQELAQRESSRLPIYTTIRSGEAHRPSFVSSVEVGGESFTGQEAKTKKQAELSVARVAYNALKQRNSMQSHVASGSGISSNRPVAFGSGDFSQSSMASSSGDLKENLVASCSDNSSKSAQNPSSQQGPKVVHFTKNFRSDLTAYFQKNVQPRLPGNDEKAEEDKEITEVISHDSPVASPGPESRSTAKRTISSSAGPSIPLSAPPDSSSDSAVSIDQSVGTSIPRHNKVVVHPRGMKMTYPPGTVLTLSDDNWVAVCTPQSSQ